jgi:hypothetical protein
VRESVGHTRGPFLRCRALTFTLCDECEDTWHSCQSFRLQENCEPVDVNRHWIGLGNYWIFVYDIVYNFSHRFHYTRFKKCTVVVCLAESTGSTPTQERSCVRGFITPMAVVSTVSCFVTATLPSQTRWKCYHFFAWYFFILVSKLLASCTRTTLLSVVTF